ncbi:MAG TPA: hypothetical protein VH988_18105 [Thermoanaerobaculia bacterium]|nr:hypothetical protein [Thermoanaerobaculia bacterium]
MNRMRSRLGLLVLFVLLVLPGLAHARPSADPGPTATHEAVHEAGLLDRAWHWVASVLMKAGSFIDPLGVKPPSAPTSTTDQIDAGSFIDPLGNG